MAAKVPLKVLVDKEKKRVVLAESGKDFVDILFSFLTLPVGTIVRLLNNQLGSFCNLYAGIGNLSSSEHLNTAACHSMLLWPRNTAADRCQKLKVNINQISSIDLTCFYCYDCYYKHITPIVYTTYSNINCSHCGRVMNSTLQWSKPEKQPISVDDGGFVNGGASFMITDDLHVLATSTSHTFALLDNLSIKEMGSALEEMTLQLGKEEILNLLKRSLISKMPLSDMCFSSSDVVDSTDNTAVKETIHIITETKKVASTESGTISKKLLVDEANNRVVYAEAGEEMMNLLFSFLTFPLGSVIQVLESNSSAGCIDNLYTSAQDLGTQYFKSQECRSQLLSPKIPAFFGCSNQLIQVPEVPSDGGIRCSKNCNWKRTPYHRDGHCQHGSNHLIYELNPKMPGRVTETGGGYAKKLPKFAVTDNLGVIPLTPISIIQIASNAKVPFDKLVEKEASIDKIQALNLLRAALTSEFALTSVFCSTEKKQRKWMRAPLNH